MTREDIIRMAQEANILEPIDLLESNQWRQDTIRELEHFAALVAAAERSACIAIIENERYFWSHQDALDVCNLAIDSIRARGRRETQLRRHP